MHLEKLFNEILLQLRYESKKYVNILLKFQKLEFYQ